MVMNKNHTVLYGITGENISQFIKLIDYAPIPIDIVPLVFHCAFLQVLFSPISLPNSTPVNQCAPQLSHSA